ncbi:MAG: crossover junction endodeoxyribonuclease RuvC [Magnetococcales bacterium]|nr:crossover junction endodeoxyribonuclease RuvC [Magnetococcales bacterium]
MHTISEQPTASSEPSQRILGIDPGSLVMGWGVIQQDATTVRHIAHGTIRTTADMPLPHRLDQIARALQRIVKLHQPDMAAVEDVFVSRNVKSALKLGHARGAAITVLAGQTLPIHEYTAVTVKKSVVGYGRADKHQVQHMVKTLLELEKTPPQDAADALAVALCHQQQARWQSAVGVHVQALGKKRPNHSQREPSPHIQDSTDSLSPSSTGNAMRPAGALPAQSGTGRSRPMLKRAIR